jgi:hypothetical protein
VRLKLWLTAALFSISALRAQDVEKWEIGPFRAILEGLSAPIPGAAIRARICGTRNLRRRQS